MTAAVPLPWPALAPARPAAGRVPATVATPALPGPVWDATGVRWEWSADEAAYTSPDPDDRPARTSGAIQRQPTYAHPPNAAQLAAVEAERTRAPRLVNEAWKPAAALALTGFLAVMAAVNFTSWGSLRNLLWLPLLYVGVRLAPRLALAFLHALWDVATAPSAASRTVTVHVEPHGEGSAARRAAAVHEGGHAAAAEAIGGKVIDARIYDDGSGWVRSRYPYSHHNRIVVAYAGQIAEGSDVGAAFDNRNIKRTLDRVPSVARGELWRGAKRATHSIVSSRQGRIHSVAARLEKRGRW